MSSKWVKVPDVQKKHSRKASPSAPPSEITAGGCKGGVIVATKPKFGAGTNKRRPVPISLTQLDQENEELKHEKVPLEVGMWIMKGRQAKGLTQKELAIKIIEKHQLIADYEAGRGIPNKAILAKIERAINMKLRGKAIGQPLPPLGKK